ncbi:MAG: glycosyltransferase family 39 protein [Candidatus Binatia bacterium]
MTVRIAHLVIIYPTPSFSYHRTWPNSDMYIFNEWAERIVAGDILCRQPYSPVLAWMLRAAPAEKWRQWLGDKPVYLKAPLYAYLIALLRSLFGDAMLPLAILQILASTLSAVLLFLITERLFDTTSATLAGLLFALYAPVIHYDVVMLRGPWIVLLSLLMSWQLIGLQHRATCAAAWRLGLAVGLALLLNEGFLSLPPLVIALLVWWARSLRRLVILAGGFLFGLATALLPLVIRNVVVGAPPLRLTIDGAKLFFAMCNAGDSSPFFFLDALPRSFSSLAEASGGSLVHLMWLCFSSFKGGITEVMGFYLRRAAALVVPFENPDNFSFYYAALRDPLLRVLPTYAVLFPFGVMGLARTVRRRFTDIEPLLPVSLVLVACLMLTLPLSRYRLPLIVFLFPFAGMEVAQVARRVRERRFRALGAEVVTLLVLITGAAVLQREVVFHNVEPTLLMYRLAEFQQAATVYSREKHFQEASEEFAELARLSRNPRVRSDAWIQAVQLRVRAAGNPAAAQAALQSLSRVSANDPHALLAIGIAYERLGQPDKALEALLGARHLAPRNADVHAALSSAYAALGDNEDAILSLIQTFIFDQARQDVWPRLFTLYERIDPGGCAFVRAEGEYRFNNSCPIARRHICQAYQRQVEVFREAHDRAAAEELQEAARHDYGCM